MSARPQQRPFDAKIEQLRVPPQSVDAEQAVLGGLMLDANAFDRIADQLNDADFYRRDHQLIYRAIRELAEKNKPFDAVTLGEWFDSQGLGEQVAGGAYLVELASTTPSAANIKAYAEIVRDKAVLRQLIDVGTGIVNDGFQPEGRDSAELLAKAEQEVFAIAEAGARGKQDFTPVRKALIDLDVAGAMGLLLRFQGVHIAGIGRERQVNAALAGVLKQLLQQEVGAFRAFLFDDGGERLHPLAGFLQIDVRRRAADGLGVGLSGHGVSPW